MWTFFRVSNQTDWNDYSKDKLVYMYSKVHIWTTKSQNFDFNLLFSFSQISLHFCQQLSWKSIVLSVKLWIKIFIKSFIGPQVVLHLSNRLLSPMGNLIEKVFSQFFVLSQQFHHFTWKITFNILLLSYISISIAFRKH